MRTIPVIPVIDTVEQLVEAMKRDIRGLIEAGRVPADIDSFSRLHDYCDANCLGGLCDEATLASMVKKFGGHGPGNELPQGMIDLINAAQDSVNGWLAHGRKR